MNDIINFQNGTRNDIIDQLTKELLGPSGETGTNSLEEEIITESPINRYSTGILYSNEEKNNYTENDFSKTDLSNEILDHEEDEVINEENISSALDHSFKPKSMGMTFYFEGNPTSINISIESAIYEKIKESPCYLLETDIENIRDIIKNTKILDENLTLVNKQLDYKKNNLAEEIETVKKYRIDLWQKYSDIDDKNIKELKRTLSFYLSKLEAFYIGNSFKRIPLTYEESIPLKEKKYIKKLGKDNQELLQFEGYIKNIPFEGRDIRSLTVIVRNISEENLFQTKLLVKEQTSFNFFPAEEINIPKLNRQSEEEQSNYLLFRKNKTYAVGHGVSAEWELNDSNQPVSVFTSYVPTYEIKPMNFDIESIPVEILMPQSYVSNSVTDAKKLLVIFIEEYEKWINKKEDEVLRLPEYLRGIATKNIEKCKIASKRMYKTIEYIEKDKAAWVAFQKANESILLQRMSESSEKEISYQTKDYSKARFVWRPFQFAFILHSFESFINAESDDRDILDLIWVSTGGGKTEAYLFAIAAVIFYRRQKLNEAKDGVTVMMRYTLRLLTAQQFDRAASLICACEYIRSKEKIFGTQEISIGLWVGGANTPNKRNEANQLIREMHESSIEEAKKKNKFQLLKCPWCNAKDSIFPEEKNAKKGNIHWGYQESKRRNSYHNFKCAKKGCFFNTNLPIHVVDEDIYKARPTLLFGTVDKFAQIALNGETAALFGTDEDIKNPELIIQDELHLISGPLGSIVGSYESAIDYILQKNGFKPKYIASTATIKNAKEQVQALYNRDVHVFPPNGIDNEDNFFVTENSNVPSRKYVGVMGTGKTQITVEIRLISSLLHTINSLNIDDELKDVYWTLTGYFNSIRELGKASTLIKDDVNDYLSILAKRNNEKKRFLSDDRMVELTSRADSSDIPEIISRLGQKYGEKEYKYIDILTATNMLSVGIDIARLNTMFVVGQPKLTSEYIQATSRVGRKDLGVVVSLYNSSRSRDRSHYETFQSYHQSLYKYVEPSSVTPYSIPSLKRTIAAILITMFRNSNPLLIQNESARYFKEYQEELDLAVDFLSDRIKSDKKTKEMYYDDAMAIIEDFIDYWTSMEQADEEENLYYYLKNDASLQGNEKFLTRSFYDGEEFEHAWEVMNSMRNIEQVSEIEILEV